MSYRQNAAGEPNAGQVVKNGAKRRSISISGGINSFGDHAMPRTPRTDTTIGRRIDMLAVRVCQAVRGVRGDRQAWIGLDLVHRELGGESPTAIDAAVAFAAAKGWLSIGGAPSHSVLLGQGAP